jgi:Holliday junction resolvasome RuvABC DNA-binding subunit
MLFRRADGLRYGSLDAARAADACERAFLGLRGLGFGEKEARRAINRLRVEGDTETLLRRALSLLTERTVRRE